MDRRAHIHFRGRVKERFGVELTFDDLEKMEECIQSGYFSKIRDQGDFVSIYRVRIGKEMAAVAYDHGSRTVITAMPVEWMSRSSMMERAIERAKRENEVFHES